MLSQTVRAQSYVAIAAGGYHSCALRDDGKLKCWGRNNHGQLGLGDVIDRGNDANQMGDDLPFVDLGEDAFVEHMALGFLSSCVILRTGKVKCWGDNRYGQAGLGKTDESVGSGPGEMGDELPAVDLGGDYRAVDLVAGYYHVCARLDDDGVKCWGHNSSGQLGRGDAIRVGQDPGQMGENLPVSDLGANLNLISLHAGGFRTCFVFDEGLKCIGYNAEAIPIGTGDQTYYGRTSQTTGDAIPFIDLGADFEVEQLAMGGVFSCAVSQEGRVKCWGQSFSGALGYEDRDSRGTTAAQMGDGLPYVDIFQGPWVESLHVSHTGFHACATSYWGTMKCWGRNASGELGLGDTRSRGDNPSEMGMDLPIIRSRPLWRFDHVAQGRYHLCALTAGEIRCVGAAGTGSLGYGDQNARGGTPGTTMFHLDPIEL